MLPIDHGGMPGTKILSWCLLMMLFWGFGTASCGSVCSSPVYCFGPLLHTIQMSSIFNDSKTFVDMNMKYNPALTLEKFEYLMNSTKFKPTDDDLQLFLDLNFEPPGSDLVSVVPEDWKERPDYIYNINDAEYEYWAEVLQKRWLLLTKKFKDDVRVNSSLYSAVYVPNAFVVPGGRFREPYYWDSYWVIRGLLISEMTQTARGMLKNFLYLVQQFGMVPNGGRVYYSSRSQPPLLVPMYQSYLEYTGDLQFLKSSIDLLEQEFQFWMKNRMTGVTKDGVIYRVAVYRDDTEGPRPEAYKTDVMDGVSLNSPEKTNEFYSEKKTAAESGWDFSSRWFMHPYKHQKRTDIKVKSIVPVDLNAIICWNAQLLSKFFLKLNNTEKALHYKDIADEWVNMLENVLYDAENGIWKDYDFQNNTQRHYFHPSNIAPLWTGCYRHSEKDHHMKKLSVYLKTNINTYRGGIPASQVYSEEQWDFPNAWAPLEHMVIMALRESSDESHRDQAFDFADKWLRNVYNVYRKTGELFEKYDVDNWRSGTGGEYGTQVGFGWTNAVTIELISTYASRLKSDEKRYYC